MLTLLYVRAGQDSRRALLERMAGLTAPCILLVPEQYSHESERVMCRLLGSGASRRCEVLSFTRLGRRLTDAAGGGAAPVLDAGGRMLLLYSALRQVADSLRFYKTPSRKPSFLNSLLATVDECISYRLAPQTLMDLGGEQGGQQGDKWHDIGLICAAYQELCAHSAADPRRAMDRLADQLHECPWAEGRHTFVHGFTDFTPQQRAVLMALAQKGEVTVTLTFDRTDGAADVFDAARRTAAALRREAGQDGVPVGEETLAGYGKYRDDSLAFAEAHLFGPVPRPMAGKAAVVRACCADPRREVEWAAAEILRLVQEEGFRFRDIALCARRADRYGELAESTFRRFGIPLFRGVMEDVLQKPVPALATAALAAVAQDYPYEEMFRYLKTDLTGLSREDRDLLENYVVTWNIRGSAWTRERPWDMHPGGYGLDFTTHDTELVRRLDRVRRQVIAPLEKLKNAPDRTGRGRAAALYDLLCDIGLEESLQNRVGGLEQRGQLAEAARYRQLWDILVGGLEQCALYLEDTELEAEEFSRLFTLVLSQYDVGAIPVSLDRVTLGDAQRLAHREAAVLFFLGADSAAIPDCESDPGLFSDQDRAALAWRRIELAPRQEDKLRREMTIVYETCAIPSQRLYISYPRQGAGGEDRAPCFLWERLERLFPDMPPVSAGESRLAAPGAAMELAGQMPAVAEALRTLPEYSRRVERLEQAARWQRGSLSPRGVEALFGPVVPMSATRLDVLNSCHFGHFLRFGLGANPRQEAKFRPTEYGTFVHEVLEKVLEQAARYGGVEGLARQDALRRSLAEEAADNYAAHSLGGLEGETARFRWLFARMKESALAVTDSVVAELAASDFEPARFELGFGKDKPLPPVEVKNGVTLSLTGFVDRVDQWLHEGKRYLRVVDYKTGSKNFSFSDVRDGRGLQMLLYLFALEKYGKAELGPEEIVPAGVLYVPARNPVVDGERSMDEKELEKKQSGLLRRKGLVLDDPAVISAMEHSDGEFRFLPISEGRTKGDYLVTPERMARLGSYVTEALSRAAGEMAAGDIAADPFWHDPNHNACRWCDYRAACHFEECCGDRKRRRKAMSAARFWAELEGKEVADDGHQAD